MFIFAEVLILKHSEKANVIFRITPVCPDGSLICALSLQHPLIHDRPPRSGQSSAKEGDLQMDT